MKPSDASEAHVAQHVLELLARKFPGAVSGLDLLIQGSLTFHHLANPHDVTNIYLPPKRFYDKLNQMVSVISSPSIKNIVDQGHGALLQIQKNITAFAKSPKDARLLLNLITKVCQLNNTIEKADGDDDLGRTFNFNQACSSLLRCLPMPPFALMSGAFLANHHGVSAVDVPQIDILAKQTNSNTFGVVDILSSDKDNFDHELAYRGWAFLDTGISYVYSLLFYTWIVTNELSETFTILLAPLKVNSCLKGVLFVIVENAEEKQRKTLLELKDTAEAMFSYGALLPLAASFSRTTGKERYTLLSHLSSLGQPMFCASFTGKRQGLITTFEDVFGRLNRGAARESPWPLLSAGALHSFEYQELTGLTPTHIYRDQRVTLPVNCTRRTGAEDMICITKPSEVLEETILNYYKSAGFEIRFGLRFGKENGRYHDVFYSGPEISETDLDNVINSAYIGLTGASDLIRYGGDPGDVSEDMKLSASYDVLFGIKRLRIGLVGDHAGVYASRLYEVFERARPYICEPTRYSQFSEWHSKSDSVDIFLTTEDAGPNVEESAPVTVELNRTKKPDAQDTPANRLFHAIESAIKGPLRKGLVAERSKLRKIVITDVPEVERLLKSSRGSYRWCSPAVCGGSVDKADIDANALVFWFKDQSLTEFLDRDLCETSLSDLRSGIKDGLSGSKKLFFWGALRKYHQCMYLPEDVTKIKRITDLHHAWEFLVYCILRSAKKRDLYNRNGPEAIRVVPPDADSSQHSQLDLLEVLNQEFGTDKRDANGKLKAPEWAAYFHNAAEDLGIHDLLCNGSGELILKTRKLQYQNLKDIYLNLTDVSVEIKVKHQIKT